MVDYNNLPVDKLCRIVVQLLREKSLKISFAESCTGGMACGAVTSVEGASEVLDFSVVTYSNQAKIDYTGVTEEILSQNGAASERTASLMADGIRKRAASDIGVGITGIAGPGGGTPEKPVGTVYISVDNGFKPMTERFMFGGGRQSVREQTVKQAMIMTIKSIEFINKSK